MKEFNTAKRDYFYSQQTLLPLTSNVYDLEKQALSEALSEQVINVTDSWHKYFTSKGFTQLNLSDKWYAYLGSLGFTGSLRDRLKQFYESEVNL
jgi:hypothetical protein